MDQTRYNQAIAAIESQKGVTLTTAQKNAGWNLCQNLTNSEFDRMLDRLMPRPTTAAASAETTIANALGLV